MKTVCVPLVAGVDEVGRGPLAGAVVAAAVILDPTCPVEGLADSKKLSPGRRESLNAVIKNKAHAWALGRAEVDEIDKLNIFHASLLAMERAILALPCQPEHILVDGKHCPKLPLSMEAVIGGDALVDCISAASIIAKVARDEEMVKLHQRYPQYGFASHKGYPTRQHREALIKYGVTPIHRTSYKPVRELLESQERS